MNRSTRARALGLILPAILCTPAKSAETAAQDTFRVLFTPEIFASVNRTKTGGSIVTVKLPESSLEALVLPFTEPTHYGMGKHGWVTSTFEEDEDPPLDLLVDWIDESYRAIAPKGLVAQLPEDGSPPTPAAKTKKKTAKKAPSKKKPTQKKAAQKKATKKTTAKRKRP